MIYMDVPEEELVKRILLRGKESGRADDASEEVIRDRIKVYHEQTAIVADFYAKQGKFADINGLGTMMKSSTASVRSSIPFGSNSDLIHIYFTGFLRQESRCFILLPEEKIFPGVRAKLGSHRTHQTNGTLRPPSDRTPRPRQPQSANSQAAAAPKIYQYI